MINSMEKIRRAASDVDPKAVGSSRSAGPSTEQPVPVHPTTSPKRGEVDTGAPLPRSILEEQPTAPSLDHVEAPSYRPTTPPDAIDREKVRWLLPLLGGVLMTKSPR